MRPAWAPGAQAERARGLGAEGGRRWPGETGDETGGAGRGTPGSPGSWRVGGRTVESRTQYNEKGRRGGGSREAGEHPWGRRRPPRGSPGSGGRLPGPGLREWGGKDTHEFLGFAAVAARRGHLVRAPALLLVPGPAAGSQAPAGRLHVQVRAGR